MSPVLTEELLIDLEVTNDCQLDSISVLQGIANTDYYIGYDDYVYFEP